MPYLRIYLALAVLSMLLAGVVYLWSPSLVYLLKDEDMLIESASALVFLAASGLALLLILRGDRRIIVLAIFSVALLCFLEEMSYGKRLFGIDGVEILGIDLTVRYVVKRVMLFFIYQPFALLLLLVASALALFILWRHIWPIPHSEHEAYLLVGLFMLLTGAALLIDAHLFGRGFLDLLEEVLELNAGTALLFAGLRLQRAGAATPIRTG